MTNILKIPLGIDTNNNILSMNLKEAPHVLVAGQTGSGKSVLLLSMITSLLMKTTPNELMFLTIDSKMVELPAFDGIPNLLSDCITDSWEAIDALKAIANMMEDRYRLLQKYKVKNIDEFNSKFHKLPYIVVVCDEIADLMMLSKNQVEESLVRIGQKGRACGIHLILATQSPRREVITGILKCNLPTRIALSTSSELDSRIILNKNGAGALIGRGDALFSNQGMEPVRFQSPLITSGEISTIVDFWKNQTPQLLAA
jgi:S-DNA-T family DNA segregation ATPase FtsK/SpoIIIE